MDYVTHHTLIFENQKERKNDKMSRKASKTNQYKMIVWSVVQMKTCTKNKNIKDLQILWYAQLTVALCKICIGKQSTSSDF